MAEGKLDLWSASRESFWEARSVAIDGDMDNVLNADTHSDESNTLTDILLPDTCC